MDKQNDLEGLLKSYLISASTFQLNLRISNQQIEHEYQHYI